MRSLFALGIAGFLIFVISCGSTSTPPADVISMAGKGTGQGGMTSSGGKAGTGSGAAGGAANMCTGIQVQCMRPVPGSTVMQAFCTDTKADTMNCGACGTACGSTQMCTQGSCSCTAPLNVCGQSCANLASDPMNCGGCNVKCSGATPYCSTGACVATCPAGVDTCGMSCTSKLTDPLNCGFCTNACTGGQACSMGTCGCVAPQTTCTGKCVDVNTDAANCGTCGHSCNGQSCAAGQCVVGGSGGMGGMSGSGPVAGMGGATAGASMGGAGGSPPIPPERMGCPITPGLISDFEEGTAVTAPVVVANEDRTGIWEIYNDKTNTSETGTVEASGGTDMCDKWAYHVKGSGYSDWGAGLGFQLAGMPMMPTVYNATAHGFTGIQFKAKLGSTADAKSPVRFNISTPWTESKDNPGGLCAPTTASTTKAAIDCYQHAGRFMSPGSGAGQLSQTFQTFTYCFDRDLYPQSLPTNLTTEQRNNIGTNMLKVQFQFNLGKDYSGSYPTEGKYPEFAKSLAFDFWVDDVKFISGDCPNMVASPSNGTPAKAFPQNSPVGTCMPPTNANVFAGNIATAYATWTKNFVQSDHIVAPEQSNHVTSEAMGYGMIIAAAMGDKTAFDKFWGYVQGKLSGGLMNWREDGSGSATDADLDIAYALAMAGKQWGGTYASAAGTMAGNIASKDISGGMVTGGSQFQQANYNPSYFAPAAMRVLSGLSGSVASNYSAVNSNISKGSQRVPTDWAKTDGTPSDAGGANVTSDITDGTNGAMGYDAARVPLRLGLDACINGATGTGLSDMVTFFAGQYDMGASIDLMKAGWYKAKAGPHTAAKDSQGSFIGPMGVAGMAASNAAMRDRAMRAMLDILESGDFNHTYFPSTVGLISLLIMSGNFPTP